MSLDSTLHSVTIYREGAVCQRTAVTTGTDRQLRIGGVPLCADPGSLRASVQSNEVRVLDVRPQFDVVMVDDVDLSAEQLAFEAAQSDVTRLEALSERLGAEIEELRDLRPAFLEPKPGDPPRESSANSLISLADFTASQLTSRLASRRQLDRQLAAARQTLALRQNRLAEASSSRRTERARLSRVAVVTLSAAPTTPLTVNVEYQVAGARWVPNYQLKLSRGLSSGTLTMRASIAQNTGEDWSNVELALSTASWARRTDVPELKALKIGRRQQTPPRSGWRAPPPGLDELFSGYDSCVKPPAPVTSDGAYGGVLGGADPRKLKKAEPPMPLKQTMVAMAVPPQASTPPGSPFGGAAPMAKPAAPMRMMSAPAPAMASASMARSRREVADDDFEGATPEMDEMAAEMGEETTGEFAIPAQKQAELAASMLDSEGLTVDYGRLTLDYARLVMAGVESSSRGRLEPLGEWGSVFAVGVSVQVDVVMAVVSRAMARATAVHSLELPALCTPVTPVNSFDYRYACQAKADVPSTGRWVNVAVADCSVGLAPEYVCVPSVEPKVYRTLQVINRSTHALLAGPVDVTAGDEFLMTTSLPAIPPSNERPYRLGLGVEEAIKVARKTSFKETTGGFLGGSTVLPHEIEIELNNRLASPASIEVRERVPWADANAEKDVKVEETSIQPPWEKIDEPLDGGPLVRGARRWKVTIDAGKTHKLLAQFTIRIPSDRMVVGGNRRN